MKLRCPIPTTYLNNGKICVVNQMFGENKNQLFYGPEGHRGLDLHTTGSVKFKRYKQKYSEGKWTGSWLAEPRTPLEKLGRIPIHAAHNGTIGLVLNKDKEAQGWGLFVTAEPEGTKQYRTLYWHIESPWRSLSAFIGAVISTVIRRKVYAGSPVAIGGNNGMSTGPHLHFSLDVREQDRNGKWGSWVRVDPMPYFGAKDVVFQRLYTMGSGDYYHEGKKITLKKAKEILNLLPKVIYEKPTE